MNDNPFENLREQIRQDVSDQFSIESVTVSKDGEAVQFRGEFIGESGAAFERIQSRLRTIGLMALARRDQARTLLTIIKGLPPVKPSRAVINLILLVLTIITTTLVG